MTLNPYRRNDMRRTLLTLVVMALTAGAARAQYLTQDFTLKAGWNAVFLHVDPSYATIDDLVAADPLQAIEEVWLWKPELSDQQFVDSPQSPLTTDTRWVSWTRALGTSSALRTMGANLPYLVKVKATVATYTWSLKGRPFVPRYQWSTSGLNFLGFPADPVTPPTFDTFLAKAPADFRLSAEFYRYPGGALGAGNPAQVFGLRTARIKRGEAYWIKTGDYYNRYYGPFEVSLSGSGIIDYGDTLRTVGLRINNLTATNLPLQLTFVPSEAAPAGRPAVTAPIPLLIRGARDGVTGKYAYTRLNAGTPASWNLAASGRDGSSIEVVLGVDRSVMTGNPGDLLAGVLRFADGAAQSRIEIGVSARVGDFTGLWVGEAAVSQVGQYLKTFSKDANGNPVVAPEGNYVIASTNTALASTASPYNLRLIVHNPAAGAATLYQRVFTGLDAQTNSILANHEASLNHSRLSEARRISAPHLPFTAANAGWDFSGPVAPNATLTVTVTNRFDDNTSNPFLHTYHPDHDNLNARFTQTLPQGSESYSIVRRLTLQFTAPSDDFAGRTSVGQGLAGVYHEQVDLLGLARGGGQVDTRTFQAQGAFQLNRLSSLPTVAKTP